MQNNRMYKNGFTLVEVIVVLVILALLAAVMIPAMTGWIDKTKQRRLITACRTCVIAAQTLVVEEYGEKGVYTTVPSASDVQSLAGIKTGSVSNISITPPKDKITTVNAINASNNELQISTLTYTADNGDFVTYVRTPSPHYSAEAPRTWVKGDKYPEGTILEAKGLLFRCISTHTSGSRSNTRDPSVKSNKGTWEVIGTVSGKPEPYSPTVRYGVGVIAAYNGNLYARTGYNLTGGQTPYSNSNSRYWTLIGKNPDA